MTKKYLAATVTTFSLLAAPARAEDSPALASAMEEYLEFAEYGSSIILPEQIPEEEWPNILVIDARDAAQFEADHIPGAINIEWRRAVARRDEIPRDKPVVIYCNTGSLSAQAVFALRLLGWDNVRVLQDGIEGWKAKGGFEDNRRAVAPARE
jgi:rhodanese-related sulfurtransferase